MPALTTASAWKNLTAHFAQVKELSIKEQFALDPERANKFSLSAAGLFLDYSKQRITAETVQHLLQLVAESDLATWREAMFNGAAINNTEKRAVLHTALRQSATPTGDELKLVTHELTRMSECVELVRQGKWRGYSGKAITDVVNIGIGGSDLGPAMVVAALQPFTDHIKTHFVSNIDATHIAETIKSLTPETTLFIIASKTFTTQETLTNAITAKGWLLNKAKTQADAIKHHFIAVTAKPERAVEFGIAQENVFPFWDWVGGRFSLWSTIGIAIAMAIGMDNFRALLAGAKAMDQHFRTAPLAQNMPVILALLGIWNSNFHQAATQAIIPYDQYLYLLPAYLQQLEMESNGKRVTRDGRVVDYKTAPVIWGSVGTNGQHAFHQLLMQGTQMVPVDFIVPLKSHNPIGDHHLLLYANCLAQSQALMMGRNADEVFAELKAQGLSLNEIEKLVPHKVIPGNIPSNMIVVDKMTPETLGALLALYEHKVFVQGVIWQINSFDQWGVELGKKLANALVPMLQRSVPIAGVDASTAALMRKF